MLRKVNWRFSMAYMRKRGAWVVLPSGEEKGKMQPCWNNSTVLLVLSDLVAGT